VVSLAALSIGRPGSVLIVILARSIADGCASWSLWDFVFLPWLRWRNIASCWWRIFIVLVSRCDRSLICLVQLLPSDSVLYAYPSFSFGSSALRLRNVYDHRRDEFEPYTILLHNLNAQAELAMLGIVIVCREERSEVGGASRLRLLTDACGIHLLRKKLSIEEVCIKYWRYSTLTCTITLKIITVMGTRAPSLVLRSWGCYLRLEPVSRLRLGKLPSYFSAPSLFVCLLGDDYHQTIWFTFSIYPH